MNYQHIYHAGNFADVIKHTILIAWLERLQQKDKPLCIIDTHAGAGWYDCQSEKTQKKQEYNNGITRLLATESAVHCVQNLQRIVRQLNQSSGFRYYPGSPYIIQHQLRKHDRMICVEKISSIFEELKLRLPSDPRVALHQRDGYEALKALLPPTPRRGLILIDPPFEDEDELTKIIAGLGNALIKWSTGCYLIWYPIKTSSLLTNFYRQLSLLPAQNIVSVEIKIFPDDFQGLMGSGLIMINLPWQFQLELSVIIQSLVTILNQRPNPYYRCRSLLPISTK